MRPDLVVDIGNSRIKWGQSRSGRIAEFASLPGDDPQAWELHLGTWGLQSPLVWVVAGVQPLWQEEFARWIRKRGDRVRELAHKDIPIRIDVDKPEAVGIDRLLNALAAQAIKPSTSPAIAIGVGTAVTVDLVREDGSFAGGTIFPGPRLMAESLHRFTAKLPLVDATEIAFEELPGKNTEAAIRAGIAHAILGGVSLLVHRMSGVQRSQTWVIATGGALGKLADFHFDNVAKTIVRPTLTLEGIRIAAELLK